MEGERANLVALPGELLEEIAQNLESRDLQNLRLACFTVARKIEHLFTRVCYAHKGFLLDSSSSIKIAIDCARHHTVGPALKHITFFVDSIANPNTAPEPNHIESEAHLRLFRWLRQRLREDCQLYLDMPVQRADLVILFEELKKWNKLKAVTFAAIVGTNRVPVFDKGNLHPSLCDFAGVMRHVLLPPSPADPLVELVLQAISLSGVTSITDLHLESCRPLDLDKLPAATFGMHGQALGYLETLSISAPYSWGWGTGLGASLYMEGFKRSITAWPFLRTLSINIGYHTQTRDCACVVNSMLFTALTEAHLASLEELQLLRAEMSFYTLLDFPQCHQGIKKLTLLFTWINYPTMLQFARYRETTRDMIVRVAGEKEVIADERTEAQLAHHR